MRRFSIFSISLIALLLYSNNDKQISREEWKGSAETFNRFDINSDGVITKEELRARRQNRRRRFNN